MPKRLTDYLEMIGQEIHDTSYLDAENTIRVITKDEQLAREIWKRALGHEENIVNADKTVTHRTFSPDPKAQEFIFERREGKFVTPQEERSISLLEKISNIVKSQVNESAERIVNDDNGNTP